MIFKKKQVWSEAELISGCIQKNRIAQQSLYEQFAPSMLGVCYRYAKNVTEAEDMMQEGFIKTFNNLKTFRQESSLRTWITKIMVNTALTYLKTNLKFREESALGLEAEEQLTAYQLHGMDTDKLMECIRQLPEGYRVVFNLYAIEGYSHKEIGEKLNITESTSRSQFTRARQQLEKQVLKLTGEKPRIYAGK